jgi:hypothetical protein
LRNKDGETRFDKVKLSEAKAAKLGARALEKNPSRVMNAPPFSDCAARKADF